MTTTRLPDRVWAVTDTKGQPVTTLAGLADALGMEAKDAAAALISGPFAPVAPPSLFTEAQDALVAWDEDEDDPDAEAKAMSKPGGGTPPPISVGSFVSWAGGRGRVDLVVTNGTPPGVPAGDGEPPTGTTDAPVARVVVYEKDGDTWKATSRKIAAKVATLKRTPPITAFGKKSVPAELGDLREEAVALADGRGLGEMWVPAPDVLLSVYERGVKAWPGSSRTDLSASQWALGRARAFCTKSLGEDVPGYSRDDDLLERPGLVPDDTTPPAGTVPVDTQETSVLPGPEPVVPEGKVLMTPADLAATLARLNA